MKTILFSIVLLTAINSIAQNDVTINTSRKDVPLQAVLNIESSNVLFAGQGYTFNLTTSGQYDVRLTAENADIELIKESKKSTGGLRYKVTPIAPGNLSMTISNVIDEKSKVSLSAYNFRVIDYPIPPIQLYKHGGGQIIEQLKDSTKLICAYPSESGIFDSYEIKSWKASIGNKTFTGDGSLLSAEIINYINQADNEFIHLVVELKKNKTGHLSTEAIFLIK